MPGRAGWADVTCFAGGARTAGGISRSALAARTGQASGPPTPPAPPGPPSPAPPE
ncbi:hypothetical protein BZL29_3145 [Mycobacterium kansasii]|uniref:Uncharacterized protein n=1 Tax=Mycobacterium kansasii TaxID=1768 RepID=A0A1V3XF88_MYCKA|nr:hypothetical protein BZL29_3145 [Mycobacterium kansasii]